MKILKDTIIQCSELEGWGPWSQLREPDFTLCFEESLLLIPNGLLVLIGIPLLYHLANQVPTHPVGFERHLTLKMIVALPLVVSNFINSIILTLDSSVSWGVDIRVLGSFFQGFTMLIMTFLSLYTHKSTYHSSTTLLLFWPVNIFLQIIELRTLNYTDHKLFHPSSFWFTILILFLSTTMFAIECYPKRISLEYRGLDEDPDLSPEVQANVYSYLTFSWMSSLLELGASKHLVAEDLWNLPKACQVTTVSEKLAQDVVGFIQPALLKRIIRYISAFNTDLPQPLYYGIGISFAMLITAVLHSLFLHHYFQLCIITGLKSRTALVTAIYQKALKLSSASGQKSTVGEIVNYMSVDSERIVDLCGYLHVIWSSIFQITFALYLLYVQMGISVFAGFSIMILVIFFNFMIGRHLRSFQQQLSKAKDSRIKLINEVLNGMKVIKLYAWERTFLAKIFYIRDNQELANLRKCALLRATVTFTSFSLPLFVNFITFTVYSILNDKPLNTETVFVTLSLLDLLAFPLNVLPDILASLVKNSVSIKRICNFLTAEELDLSAVRKLPRSTDSNSPAIEVSNGSFSWGTKVAPAISHINLRILNGELVGIVGRVGSGKSSFISSLLGDMNKKDGNVTVRGSVAYVPQQPWIMNATVRDNITFGHRYEPDFYNETIRVCALKQDLDMLISGDLTEIGERGINLSGGQKARISLARAVYARSDVYLLDDPLSAVDAHVGKHIFDNVISKNGILKHKTRVLVTHAILFLDQLDQIAMFDSGRIAEMGSYNNLKQNPDSGIHQLTASKAQKLEEVIERETADQISRSRQPDVKRKTTSQEKLPSNNSETQGSSFSPLPDLKNKVSSTQVVSQGASYQMYKDTATPNRGKLMTTEKSVKKSVDHSVYLAYFKACSVWYIVIFLLLTFISQFTSLGGILWLKRWTEVNSNSQVILNILIYGLIGASSGIATFFQFITLYIYCGLHAAKSTFGQMVISVVRAPMVFFDTTPLGRIVNRFSKDQSTIDEILPQTFGGFINSLMKVIFIVVVISYSTSAFIAIVLVLVVLSRRIQLYYLATICDLKRLDSASRSPIFAHFQETLNGASSIRAYQQQSRFTNENAEKLEINLRSRYPSLSLNRWLSIRLEFLSAIVVFSSAILVVLALNWGVPIDPSVAGLAITYALNVTQSLNWSVRHYCKIETNIISMERIKEYIELPAEAPYDAPFDVSSPIPDDSIIMNHPEDSQALQSVPKNWPSEGKIEFKSYSTQHRAGPDLILRDLSLSINPGEKVGIVGRTGAGKSSLTLALFRIVEAVHGFIMVDDIDISKISLYDLRSRLSIIPQDPVLFAGSVRFNLDPLNKATDTDLWRALDQTNLKECISEMEGQLDATVFHGGENFSVGQRQLICLARALVRHSSILILDEATASIDHQTDNLIQQTIRSIFKHCTVLTIAHRINTVMDNDNILVLDKGLAKEFDSPSNLLKDKYSLFYKLAQDAQVI